jgi:hypothetical protein
MGKNPETIERQKNIMLEALEANNSNVRKAAEMAGITPQTHYRWRNEDKDYNSCVIQVKEISNKELKNTLLESALNKINEGNTAVLNQMLRIYFKNTDEYIE